MRTVFLEGKNILLSPLSKEDNLDDYANWLNNPEINKYLSCTNTFQTMESCLAYVN